MFTVAPSEGAKGKKRKISEVSESKSIETSEKRSKNGNVAVVEKRERKKSETYVVNGLVETHVTLSPKTPPGDPPEPEELIKVYFNCILFQFIN